ncbi:hypothetical protein EVAR_23862_1 [Eumeta japonica]|uniref:Uncharacterized protein n=1 Tax=Eumeta variegata TaxID=151549 RepID=A0A4C1V4E8_EUMVA|nr:hypothetical protein EVAR_23862_1 [Eumeta japonica]
MRKGIKQNGCSQFHTPYIQPVIRYIPRTTDTPVPKTSTTWADILSSDVVGAITELADGSNSEFGNDRSPKLFFQDQRNDFVRDLNLPKDATELLASRLKNQNVLLPVEIEQITRPKTVGRRGSLKLVKRTSSEKPRYLNPGLKFTAKKTPAGDETAARGDAAAASGAPAPKGSTGFYEGSRRPEQAEPR